MVRILADDDIASVLELSSLLDVVEEAFRKQGQGAVERPQRPHFPVGTGLDADTPTEPLGTGLTMPAYIHGADYYANKLVGHHEGNAERGLPTVQAQIALTEAATGQPAAFMAGTRITNARTGCIGGLAARELGHTPVTLGMIGAGAQARWQTRAIAAATDLDAVRVYSPSDSKHDCVADLRELIDANVTAAETPTAAVGDANVVVTATTATNPVFPGDALSPGTVVIAVGAYTGEMQELDSRTFERAAHFFADVPEEVATIGDAVAAGLDAADFVPLSEVFEGTSGRTDDAEIIVVESVGTAVLDAASAEHLYREAAEADVGTAVSL